MDPVFDFGMEATRWLQAAFPQLEGFFHFVSALGLEEFYLALLPLIYWSLNKRLGRSLAYVFLFANLFNPFFKHALRGPRPFWLDASVGLDVETSYGVPSGHVQAATTTYLFLAAWLRQRWVWLLAVLFILIMGISRIYLGVHFVHDAVAGFLIGAVVVAGYLIWRRRFAESFGKRILGYRLMVAALVPAIAAVLYVGVMLALGGPDTTVRWAAFLEDAELSSIEDMTTAVASLLGIGIGLMLESSRVRFRVEGPWWQRLLRYVIGIAVAVGIWAGLSAIFPRDPLWLAIPLRIVRYTLLTLWVAYYAPWVFVKLRLATADPAPEISVSL